MSDASPRLISADAVIPMDAAGAKILLNAGVVVTGERITAVGELAELRRQFGELPVERHEGVLIPGLVNAHTHLELSYQKASALAGAHFTRWVSGMMASYPPADQVESVVRAATRKGAGASVRAGVTTLGDISRHAAFTRDELARSAAGSVPRVVSYGEVVGLGKMRDRAAGMIEAATMPPHLVTPSPFHLVTGISPHAPYTVEGPTLRACVRQAIIKRAPVTMHLAELLEEIEFLSDIAGALGPEWDLMQKLDVLDDRIPRMQGGPIRWAQRWGLLIADARERVPRSFPVLLAHVNYCDRGEMAQLAVSRASVAYCPRTHAFFGHPPHRYREMLENGINVCLGTDSLASNPDLSVLREAQLLCARDGFDPYGALEMITRRAAEAIGMGALVGTLAAGKLADMVLMPMNGEDVVRGIVEQAPEPRAIWIGGKSAAKQ